MKKISQFCFFLLFTCLTGYSQIFTDVASGMGINHYFAGYFNGSGITFCDFDLDGKDDLLLPRDVGNYISMLKNDVTSFQEVVQQYNVNQRFEPHTILVADYDNDGDRDIFISNFKGYVKLFRNNGTTFDDVSSSSGMPLDSSIYTAAIILDYNKDGLLDAYFGVYSGYTGFPDKDNRLLKNLGNGSFQDVTQSASIGNFGNKVLALAALDYNNDSWPDIYIACDRRYGNKLFKNNGNGTFSDVSVQSGTNLEMDAMGLAIGDYDNNGYFDIYVSNGEDGNAFLKNNGNGTFTNVAAQLGMSVNRICWGNNFIDYDNDGDLDLVVAVSGGNPDRHNVLFSNNGNGTFTRLSNSGFDSYNTQTYGCAAGDYNNDGFTDIAFLNVGDNAELWKNNGGNNRWIKIKLQGTYSNREGIGSVIEVFRNSTKFIRYVNCGLSYGGQNSHIQTIGAGSYQTIDSIAVYWPSGIRQVVQNVSTNQTITVLETGVIGISNNNNQFPDNYMLFQNYPNPFNPSTMIKYSLPKSSNVVIKLYDVLGNQIAILESSFKNSGIYDVTLSENITSKMSSGIYYYKMTAGEFSHTKKMILIK